MTIIKGIEEEVLIQRLINGDQTAFELLFRFYYPGLVTFASQIVLNQEDAEEIVQDFFLKLWAKRNDIRNSNSLKGYFFTSIKNSSLNFLKKEKISEKIRSEFKYLTENDRLYNPDLFVVSELQSRIKEAFGKLPPRANEIFKLSRFRGLSNDEIAEKLNISKRTVETQISNSLKILRVELKDYLFLLLLL
jgi:RNA polymerase sigma-70 factor (ECF subfamily)